uniref:Uncharacterized protein n=1 Tax=Microplitis mediator bracovirus TaxID=1836595 RepID=A0A2I6SGU7_9VIRU|nr:hypothetical protein MmBV_CLP5 [Microplitis mediator bracovirus]
MIKYMTNSTQSATTVLSHHRKTITSSWITKYRAARGLIK